MYIIVPTICLNLKGTQTNITEVKHFQTEISMNIFTNGLLVRYYPCLFVCCGS